MNRIAAIVASLLVTVAFGFTGVAAAGSSPAGDLSTASSDVDVASMSATAGFALASPVVGAAQENTTEEDGTEENETDETETGENDTAERDNESVAPGARLAGVLGAQQEEVQGEVESRAFGHAIAAARSNGSKARLVANNTDRLQERLQHLEERLETLNESVEKGAIPRGAYYAKVTRLTAEIGTTERLINQTADTARVLPPQARMEHGVNVTRLDHLRSQARNLSGSEVSSIARHMAGPGVGKQMGQRRGPPNGTPGQGPPDGSQGPGHAGDSQGQNGSGNMGPPGTNQTDSNTTAQGPPNGTDNSSNQSGQGNGGQGPPDDGDDDADSVDRPGLTGDLGSANGLLAAMFRSVTGVVG